MIEFRKDKGPWWCCNADDDCEAPAAPIVEDGVWYYVSACDNEQHIAEALAYHAQEKANGGHGGHAINFDDCRGGPRSDGMTWEGKVA